MQKRLRIRGRSYNDILDGWKEAEDAAFTINEEEWAKVVFEDRFKAPEVETESETESVETTDTENVQATEEYDFGKEGISNRGFLN